MKPIMLPQEHDMELVREPRPNTIVPQISVTSHLVTQTRYQTHPNHALSIVFLSLTLIPLYSILSNSMPPSFEYRRWFSCFKDLYMVLRKGSVSSKRPCVHSGAGKVSKNVSLNTLQTYISQLSLETGTKSR